MLRYGTIALIAAIIAVAMFVQVSVAEEPTEEWKYSTNTYITASPVYLNNMLYVGAQNGKMYFMSTLTGTPQGIPFVTHNQTPSAIKGTPLVVNDQATNRRILYFGSDQGTLFSVNGLTGKEIWKYQAGAPIDGTPTLYNGILFFGTFDNKVHALLAEDGQAQWNYTADGWISEGIEAKDNFIFFGSQDGNLYCLEVYTGKLKWKTDLKSRVNAPIIDGDVIYVGTQDGYVHAVDRYSGNEQWTFETDGAIVSKPLVQLNTVYVGSADGNAYALNESTGKLLWKFPTGDGVKATPGFDSGIIYIGSGDGNVYAVDARMGLEYWRYKVGNAVDTTPTAGIGTDKKTHLYFATVNGDVYGLKLPSSLIMATPTPKPQPTEAPTTVPSPTVTVTPTLVPLPSISPTPQYSWCPLPGLFAAALAVVGIAYRRRR